MLVFGLIVVAIGLVFVGFGHYAQKQANELQAHGVTEPAQIIGASIESGSKGKKRYILTVQWGEAQAQQTQKFAVGKKHFESKVEGKDKIVTAATTVRLIPGQPDTAVVEGGLTSFSGAQWAGYFVVLLGALMTYKGFR